MKKKSFFFVMLKLKMNGEINRKLMRRKKEEWNSLTEPWQITRANFLFLNNFVRFIYY